MTLWADYNFDLFCVLSAIKLNQKLHKLCEKHILWLLPFETRNYKHNDASVGASAAHLHYFEYFEGVNKSFKAAIFFKVRTHGSTLRWETSCTLFKLTKKQFLKNKKQAIWVKVYLINSFFLSLSVYLWVWAPSSLLLSSDSRLFSPTLSRDLIEGNHSDKKPPQSCGRTCVYMSAYVRAPLPSNPATTSPVLLPPIKMPCCSLDPCLALYLPKRAFCVAQKRATVSGREWEEALVIGAKGGGSSPVVSDLWEHLLNIRRAGVLPKMLHFSLLSPALLAPHNHQNDPPPVKPTTVTSVWIIGWLFWFDFFQTIKAFQHSHSLIIYERFVMSPIPFWGRTPTALVTRRAHKICTLIAKPSTWRAPHHPLCLSLSPFTNEEVAMVSLWCD